MPETYDNYSTDEINSAFAERFLTPGMEKEAAVSIESFIRDYAREDSVVADKILTEQQISFNDIDRSLDPNKIRKIVELEPDSKAMWISFRGLPPSTYIETENAEVPFALVTTHDTVKNIFELKTQKNDIRKIIHDNHVKDILFQQDGKFFGTVDKLVIDNGYIDTFSGGFTKNNVAEAMKALDRKKIPLGCIVINSATARDLLKWDSNDVGDNWAESQYEKGLTITTLMGTKLLITNKHEYVPDNFGYFFGKEDFLGKFFTLQDSTVYFEQRGYIIRFHAYKLLGMLIANAKACFRGFFEP